MNAIVNNRDLKFQIFPRLPNLIKNSIIFKHFKFSNIENKKEI